MLFSYLKIAWKVLMRRKFFTFISLFGVSFTLMILLVVMAMFDHVVGPSTPAKRIDQMVFVNTIRNQMVGGHGWMNMPASIHFVDDYVRKMKTPEKVGISTAPANATAFTKSKLLALDLAYTDGDFWQIMDFDFLGGRAFTHDEVKQAQHVCVLNEASARGYFGTADAVGRTIEIDLKRYRVAGVVRNVSAAHVYAYADVWVPYTLSPQFYKDNRINGEYASESAEVLGLPFEEWGWRGVIVPDFLFAVRDDELALHGGLHLPALGGAAGRTREMV